MSGAEGRRTGEGGLTQERRVSVAEGETLVPGHTEGREHVEALVQERLQAGSRGIGGVEQVVNLLAGWAQGRHWRVERDRRRSTKLVKKQHFGSGGGDPTGDDFKEPRHHIPVRFGGKIKSSPLPLELQRFP